MTNIPILTVISVFFIAALITLFLTPSIIKISKARKLTDDPDLRKVHASNVPHLGGIAIITSFIICTLLFIDEIPNISIILVCLIFVVLIGLRDDLIITNAKIKLAFEIALAFCLSICGNIRFTSLHGFLGVYEISYPVSIVLTSFFIVALINSYNLIDGVDGLAGGIALIACLFFGFIFGTNGEYGFLNITIALAGGIIAFLPFNMINGRYKLFMGDTGSLSIGFLLSILTIRFNELNLNETIPVNFRAAPAISLAVFFVPVFDTLRVIVVRSIKGVHIFRPDRNHIHHRLLRLGFSHQKTTAVLILITIACIACSLLMDNLGVMFLVIFLLILAVVLSVLSLYFEKRHWAKAIAVKLRKSKLQKNVLQEDKNKIAI